MIWNKVLSFHRGRCEKIYEVRIKRSDWNIEDWRWIISQFKAWHTESPESCLCWSEEQLPGLLSEGSEFVVVVDVAQADLELLLTRVNTWGRSGTQFGIEWTGRRTGWGSLEIFHLKCFTKITRNWIILQQKFYSLEREKSL